MDTFRKLPFFSNEHVVGQFMRCGIIGGIASLVDISIYSLGANILGINHILANTLSFLFGLIINYYLTREWVFNQKTDHTGKDFLVFSVIGVIGLVISNVLLLLMVNTGLLYAVLMTNSDALVRSAAKIITVVVVFFWNFTARKKLVFST